MPSNFNRPTLAQLIDRVQTDLEGALTGVNARLRRTVENVLARALAGLAHGQHGHIAWVAEQILPDTAVERYLVRWADFFGVDRLDGIKAQRTITVQGSGGDIPEGRIWIRAADGAQFTTDAEHLTVGADHPVPITAVLVGTAGNLDISDIVSLEASIPNIESDAVVASEDVAGVDQESLESLLERLLEKIRKAPLGGAPGDHVIWAKEVEGVTRAWEYKGTNGIGNPGLGKVALAFVRDGDGAGAAIIPDAGEVAAVQAYVQAKSPAEVIAFAPTAVTYDTTMELAPYPSVPVEAAVDAELADLLLRTAEPGGTILWSLANEAISLAEGETDHVLTSPAGNVPHAFGELAIPGVNTKGPIT
ncbi:MAG: baseplate J/gp47 family protein [Myxococcales bacterium]|nr:baseplate J/gp47 family protein [Myxococcales bacterium]